MEVETLKFKTLEFAQSEEVLIKVGNHLSENMVIENPPPDFAKIDGIFGMSSKVESLPFPEITGTEGNPTVKTMGIENPTSDFSQSEQTLSGCSKIVNAECTETLAASTLEESRKSDVSQNFGKELEVTQSTKTLDDSVKEHPPPQTMEIENSTSDFPASELSLGDSSNFEVGECSKTLSQSNQEESRKIDNYRDGGENLEDMQLINIVDAQLPKTLDESVKAGKVDAMEEDKFSKNVIKLSSDGTDNTDTVAELELQLDFNVGGSDGYSPDAEEPRLDIVPYGRPYSKPCRCVNCVKEEYRRRNMEEYHRRNHGRSFLRHLGWPNHGEPHDELNDFEFGPSGGMPLGYMGVRMPYNRKHQHRRRDNYMGMGREYECNGFNSWSFMGRDDKRFGHPVRFHEPEPFPVGAGLANLGNTCFLNAIMQCFTHTVVLVQGLLSLKHDASSHGSGEYCVLCAVRDQIERSIASSERVLWPSNLVDNLSNISSYFRRYQQEDAHEFLQCLLDKLDSFWLKYETSANDESTVGILSSPDDSLVKKIFGGRLVSQVCCSKCGHNSDTFEPLIDLSLEIEDVDSLDSALESFTKVECIEDTEMFTCASCKEQVQVEKQLMLDQVPSVASLHLKRFKSDGVDVEKIDKMVKYPLELDLAPYTKGSSDQNEDLKYELFALVVHVGLSATSGHYFCYIRTSPDEWYRFDDSKVSRVSEECALHQDAYILFYARKGTPWFGSLIEQWKEDLCEKILSTSPKSVLYDMGIPSSFLVGTSSHGCEPDKKCDDAICNTCTVPEIKAEIGTDLQDFEAVKKSVVTEDTSMVTATEVIQVEVETKAGVDAQDSAVVNLVSAVSSTVLLNGEVKDDKSELDAWLIEEESCASKDKRCSKSIVEIEETSGGTCCPSYVEKIFDGEPKHDVGIITPSTAVRDESSDLYFGEETAEVPYDIPLDHLKIKSKSSSSAKKSVNNSKQDMKRKEAAKYLIKSMFGASGRRRSFLSALSPPSNSSSSKKRRKHCPIIPPKQSPRKRVKISPKRYQRPVTV